MMGGQICACDIMNEEYANQKQHLPKSSLSLYAQCIAHTHDDDAQETGRRSGEGG